MAYDYWRQVVTDKDPEDWGSLPKQAKGGVFSTADIPLIKKALVHYAGSLVLEEGDLDTDPARRNAEINQIANLLHRLNNRI